MRAEEAEEEDIYNFSRKCSPGLLLKTRARLAFTLSSRISH
jgi:hypothetical protein